VSGLRLALIEYYPLFWIIVSFRSDPMRIDGDFLCNSS
jgi:hypothetical protein